MRLVTVVLIFSVLVFAAYILLPKSYVYESSTTSNKVHVRFNRPLSLRKVRIQEVEKRVQKVGLETRYSYETTGPVSVLRPVTAKVDELTVTIPGVAGRDLVWVENKRTLEPGRSFILSWDNHDIVVGFDVVTSGALAW